MNDILEPPSLCRQGRSVDVEVEFGQHAYDAVSGERLVARFALACAWEKFQRGYMPASEWFRLRTIAISGISKPKFDGRFDRMFLVTYFPGLFRESNPNDWSHQGILDYLLAHKGHAEECAARVAVIGDRMRDLPSPIMGDSRPMFSTERSPLQDLYRIDPVSGSRVLSHKSIIVTLI